jgi:hypothetical protein
VLHVPDIETLRKREFVKLLKRGNSCNLDLDASDHSDVDIELNSCSFSAKFKGIHL